MTKTAIALSCLVLLATTGCKKDPPEPTETTPDAAERLDATAERYVRLVLALGEHDDGYVDAYYGPAEWRDEVQAETPSLEQLEDEARKVIDALRNTDTGEAEAELETRRRFLKRQTEAVLARIEILGGNELSFDEESEALYGAQAPHQGAGHYDEILRELGEVLPGEGEISERYNDYRSRFVIPTESLDSVFQRAIDECRRRTAAHVDLPESENFVLEYVTDQAWSGYNWYQGDFQSLIQINTDFPIYIDRAVDLACHEGYPGHHVYNLLLEKHLVQDRGWVENSVYPLYSPQSLIAEGSANYGKKVAFSEEERLAFERDVLFPLAGLDPAGVEEYYEIKDLVDDLAYAGNEAARQYLDGDIDAQAAADWLVRYSLMTPERAEQRVRFIDNYRSYVINYNLGQDLVREHVEAESDGTTEGRWRVFSELLSTQTLPSQLSRTGGVH